MSGAIKDSNLLSPSGGITTQANSKKSSISQIGPAVAAQSNNKNNNNINTSNNIQKKKRQVTWKEEFEVHEVDNWKEFNVLDDDSDKTDCKCSVF